MAPRHVSSSQRNDGRPSGQPSSSSKHRRNNSRNSNGAKAPTSTAVGPVTSQSFFNQFSTQQMFDYPDINALSRATPVSYRDPYAQPHSLRQVRWNNVGSKLACLNNGRNMRIWTADRPDPKQSVEIRNASAESWCKLALESLSWDPLEPETFVVVSGDGVLKKFDARTKEEYGEYKFDGDTFLVQYSRDGEKVAVARRDNKIVVLDRTLTNVVCEYSEPYEEIWQVSWSNNSDYFACSLGSGDVRVIKTDSEQGQVVYTLKGHRTAASCIEFDPYEGRYLAAGSNEGIVSIWQLDTCEPICVNSFSTNHAISALSFSYDGLYIAVATTEQSVQGSTTHPKIEIISTLTGQSVVSLNRPNCCSHPSLHWHPSRYVLATTGDPHGVSVYGSISIK